MGGIEPQKRSMIRKWFSMVCFSFYPIVLFSQVLNGNFETDGQPSLDNWIISCIGESYQNAPSSGGNWCLKLASGNYQGCFPGIACQIIPDIQNGEIWQVSVWSKQDYLDTYTSIYFTIMHATGGTTVLSVDSTTSNDWIQLTVIDTLMLDQGDSVAIILDAGMTTGPAVNLSYFDLVTAEKIGELEIHSDHNGFIPDELKLFQNYPNPFNPVTTISYQLPKSEFVNLSIYNVAGQLIETFVSEHKNAGYHSVLWNASGVGSGLYFYRIEAGEFKETKKCLILK